MWTPVNYNVNIIKIIIMKKFQTIAQLLQSGNKHISNIE